VAWLVDQYSRRGQRSGPDLTSLLEAANSSTKSWLRWKGLLADGTRPGEVLLHPETVMSVLQEAEAAGREWMLHSDRTRFDAYEIMAAGLLRKASGLSLRELANRLKLSPSTARRHLEIHQVRMTEDDAYAHRAMALLSGAGAREVRQLLGTPAPGVMR
jgi:DNA-binding transcriptional ArsR family regulator